MKGEGQGWQQVSKENIGLWGSRLTREGKMGDVVEVVRLHVVVASFSSTPVARRRARRHGHGGRAWRGGGMLGIRGVFWLDEAALGTRRALARWG